MEKSKELTITDVEERLVDYLPEWQRIFTSTPSYKQLCQKLFEYINAEKEAQSKVELYHAKLMFDNLCEKDPEGLKEKERVQREQEVRQKERKLNSLYNEHIKDILKEKL